MALMLLLAGCTSQQEKDAQSEGLQMESGRWETAYDFNSIDIPALSAEHEKAISAEISKQASGPSCLAPGLKNQPNASFFGGRGTSECAYTQYDIRTGNAKIKLSCNMQGFGTVDIEMFGPITKDHYEFDTNIALRLPMIGRVAMRGKSAGKFVGPCNGSE